MSRPERRRKIHQRIRGKVLGTAQRPRLCVFRSLSHTYAQLLDDQQGRTLATVSTLKLEGQKVEHGGNVAAAKRIGTAIAGKAKELGIEAVVFDRNGYVYHGRVRAVAEAAREAGLRF